MKCKICGNEKGNKKFEVKEMMFGMRDEFVYFQCANCECLQIKDVPNIMFKYYPSDYYSFAHPCEFKKPIKRIAKRLRDHYAVFNKGVVGKLIYMRFHNRALRSLSRLKLKKDLRILDVGCGSGSLLDSLAELGFKHLLGIDPYIRKNIHYVNGLKVLKKTIYHIKAEFDIIMFHQSFEHMDSPFDILQVVRRLLSSHGICLISVPVVDSWAWENYKTNWVGIDAPRHFFLYSKKSMQILSRKAGFRIKEIVCVSTERQFWVSEQYKKSIPLRSENSFSVNPSKASFSKMEMRKFKRKAEKLNSENRGDQAVFYLEKI